MLAVLDALADEYREERYRAAPLLRHHVWAGRLGHATGAGFFDTTRERRLTNAAAPAFY